MPPERSRHGQAFAGFEMQAISYCTNIHPGESWQEIFAAVRGHAPLVRERIVPGGIFPLGLRLSGRAAGEMSREDALNFRSWCRDEGLEVATLNGFPYGRFHHARVKEAVYLPDWRQAERLDYTLKLAELLAIWLPPERRGSISTVPLGFGSAFTPEDFTQARKHVRAALDYLDHLTQRTGQEILLSMEPEPCCLIETTRDVVDVFERLELSPRQQRLLAVCFDCCHQALQYETPAESLALLAWHDIRIGHVQVSSALRLLHPDIRRLERFRGACYLHQAVGRRAGGQLLRYHDLGPAIAASTDGVEEWRVHVHVPVFMDAISGCRSTRFFLEEILPLFPQDLPMEVETYTWSVLPSDLCGGSVTDCIVREIEWVRKTIGTTE